MLKIHATKKLFAKLPLNNEGLLPQLNGLYSPATDSASLNDWVAHLITVDRCQCVLFIHQQTRFPVFIPAVRKPAFKQLELLFEESFLNTLLKLGMSQAALEKAQSLLGRFQVASKTDRSTLGVMTQLKTTLEFICAEYDLIDTTGYSISRELAKQICRSPNKKDYIVPAQEMALLLGEPEQAAKQLSLSGSSKSFDSYTHDDDHYFVLMRYLELHASEHGMQNLPELHGFLTGVVLCLNPITPSQWIPEVWGGQDLAPRWSSTKEAEEFHTALMALYNEIAGELSDNADTFEPLFAKYFEHANRNFSTPWCYGFMAGFILDPTHEFLPQDAHANLAIMALPFDPKFAKEFDANGDIINEHCEQVLVAIKALHFFTRSAPKHSNVIPFKRK